MLHCDVFVWHSEVKLLGFCCRYWWEGIDWRVRARGKYHGDRYPKPGRTVLFWTCHVQQCWHGEKDGVGLWSDWLQMVATCFFAFCFWYFQWAAIVCNSSPLPWFSSAQNRNVLTRHTNTAAMVRAPVFPLRPCRIWQKNSGLKYPQHSSDVWKGRIKSWSATWRSDSQNSKIFSLDSWSDVLLSCRVYSNVEKCTLFILSDCRCFAQFQFKPFYSVFECVWHSGLNRTAWLNLSFWWRSIFRNR
jgi:hypothetical protein